MHFAASHSPPSAQHRGHNRQGESETNGALGSTDMDLLIFQQEVNLLRGLQPGLPPVYQMRTTQRCNSHCGFPDGADHAFTHLSSSLACPLILKNQRDPNQDSP